MDIRLVLEKLYIQNGFICPYTDERMYQFLESERGLATVNHALSPFDRKVSLLENGGAFFIDTTDNTNNNDNSQRRRQFEKIRDDLQPFVEFFVYISRVKPSAGILSSGQTIRFSEILSLVTDNDLNTKHLSQLLSFKMFKTSKQATSEKLQVIFERLVKEGLLINKNKSEMLYQVTGKYDYIQHVMQFIIDRENIVIDEGKDEAQKGFVI
jgi:hypothetical protein